MDAVALQQCAGRVTGRFHYEGARCFPMPTARPIMRFVVSSIVVQYTDLLRTSDYDLWSRLRELLKGQGLDPDGAIVVDLFQEGPDHEDGQVISEDGRVYRFTLFYDQAAEHVALSAYLHDWTDITDSWRTGSLAIRTADAFAWMSRSTEWS
ncbi:hypothetical protein [Streptomyces sp. NBC_01446]|uniref:hypothetical protein n=1 Tax=unclassified Streptomyces TaxID=2593676 RepID=UPI00225AC321|nr:hypothetical protein [Streptomyces sp. NBC_01446]MCX4649524.1 hypothetical protein [Streptomyces sp. NBC_01446]